MKKIILTVFTASILFACNNSCEKSACGSEGHTCTSECKKTATEDEAMNQPMDATTETDETELAEHICSADCKEGSCVMAHGEKGHVCGADCL
ncbi:MAG: hypothetical protein AB7O47_00905 [Flavobacteriales bacterium]